MTDSHRLKVATDDASAAMTGTTIITSSNSHTNNNNKNNQLSTKLRNDSSSSKYQNHNHNNNSHSNNSNDLYGSASASIRSSKGVNPYTDYSKEAETIKNNDYFQMKCKANELKYGIFWVQCVYLAIALIFIPIGIIALHVSSTVKYQEFDAYSSYSDCKINDFDKNASWGKSCNVIYEINEDFDAPIYFYYKVKSMYVNHRSYVMSRNDEQLRGKSSHTDDCSPMTSYSGKTLVPCGLIAYSFFNDKYKVSHISSNGDITHLCNSTQCDMNEKDNIWSDASWHAEPYWSKSGIAWASDRNERFKKTKLNDEQTRSGKLQTWQGVTLPNTTDEDFIVWMRTATVSEFLKLHRINRKLDFKKGDTLNITIHNYFEVGSFDGSKSLVISTTSSLGGKNSAMGIIFIVVGCISLVAAVFFCIFFRTNSEHPYEIAA